MFLTVIIDNNNNNRKKLKQFICVLFFIKSPIGVTCYRKFSNVRIDTLV